MPTTLMVAAGGGGDAIAARLLHAAAHPVTAPAHLGAEADTLVLASFAWDRSLIDPVPGPRDPRWFEKLEPAGARNHRVTSSSRLLPGAGSLLPRLAAALGAPLYLLDPRGGALGLGDQLGELAGLIGAERVQLVDVGGDILARGDEPTLRSPLADSLALAACAALYAEVEVVVTGAGLDGELSGDEVRERLRGLGGRQRPRLTDVDVKDHLELFAWHPSEVNGLLALAASGARGVAEIRDSGLRVVLDDETADVHHLPAAAALRGNLLAGDLVGTRSLREVERGVRAWRGSTEIDAERRRAIASPGRAAQRDHLDTDEVLDRLGCVSREAGERGIDLLTMRRVALLLGLGAGQLDELRAELVRRHHPQYSPPVWTVERRA